MTRCSLLFVALAPSLIACADPDPAPDDDGPALPYEGLGPFELIEAGHSG